MKINTKVVFEWNPKSKQYEEVYCDSYEYDGEVAECQYSIWGDPSGQTSLMQSLMGQQGYSSNNLQFNPLGQQFSGLPQQGFGSSSGWLGGIPSQLAKLAPSGVGQNLGIRDIKREGISNELTSVGPLAEVPVPDPLASPPSLFDKMKTAWGGVSSEQKAGGLGALAGGFLGYRQAKAQKKGLGVAIDEIDPLKGKFMGEHKRQLGLAEAYRPGGKYSQYMAGQMYSQAAESAGQESQRMIASGITSPSMMRAMARQSRRRTQAAMPGMELQLSQMALPYEQLGAKSLTQYGGVVEQLASLKGARASIDPTASAVSGAMQGMMGAASMIGSLASDRRIKKDIKYLHTSNDGHKVYSFKYKGGDTKYSGVMAQDVLKINPNAVVLKNGILAVYYDMIDVNMQQLDIIQ